MENVRAFFMLRLLFSVVSTLHISSYMQNDVQLNDAQCY
jgi:hypothetical protein